MCVCCRYCIALDDVAGDFVTAMAQKNPKLKAAALQVLQVQDPPSTCMAEVWSDWHSGPFLHLDAV